MAPPRMTTDGGGPGWRFLAALTSGAAMPMTVAITISHRRYSATSQVHAFRCASAHRAGPEFIASSLAAVHVDCFTYPAFRNLAVRPHRSAGRDFRSDRSYAPHWRQRWEAVDGIVRWQ